MIIYYRKNDSKPLKHQIGSLLSVFFQEKNILKFLKLKDKSIFVKDFFYFYKSWTQEDGASTSERNFFLRFIFQYHVLFFKSVSPCPSVGSKLFLTDPNDFELSKN